MNQARAEIAEPGVRVYHATEVNLVVQSMKQGAANMVNSVLPHTKLDPVVSRKANHLGTAGQSLRFAQGGSENPQVLRSALDFIAANMPDSPDFGDRNVYIGEFGMPENLYPAERIQRGIPNVVKTGLDWGCPYIVYWQLYCNELKDTQAKPPVKSNDAVRGFWLIRPDGSKAWTWDYFYSLLNSAAK